MLLTSAASCQRSRPAVALVAAGLLALLVALLLPAGAAFAHAQIRETFPVDGQRLEEAPTEAWVRFNEGVQLPTAGLRVFDATGERVDAADAAVDGEDPSRIVVGLDPALGEGTYIVTWRAVSADGHPLKGAWLYTVGEGGEVGDDLLAQVFSGGGDGPLVVASVLNRGVGLAALLLLGGTGLFWLVAARRDANAEEHEALARLGRGAAIVVAVTAILGIPLQAMLETGLGLGALAPAPLLDVVTAPVGLSALVRAAAGVAILVRLRRVTPAAWDMPTTALGLLAVLAPAGEGHQVTQDPIALILLSDVVHLVAAAAWTGGLASLWLTLRSRRRADDPVGGAQLVAGFSRLATWSLLAVVVAGSAMSWVTVRALRAVTTTDYGRTLLVKLALVGLLILVGLYNKRRLVPAIVAGASPAGGSPDAPPTADAAADLRRRIADGAWVRLRQTLRAELALIGVVALVTGLLVGLQPASQEAGVTGAFSTYADLTEDFEVNLVVDPNRAGLNEVHIYLLDRTGRTVDSEDVQFLLELPARDLGPFDRTPRDAGPGHWSLTGRELAVAGEWEITVVIRLDTFSEGRVTIPFTVNP